MLVFVLRKNLKILEVQSHTLGDYKYYIISPFRSHWYILGARSLLPAAPLGGAESCFRRRSCSARGWSPRRPGTSGRVPGAGAAGKSELQVLKEQVFSVSIKHAQIQDTFLKKIYSTNLLMNWEVARNCRYKFLCTLP